MDGFAPLVASPYVGRLATRDVDLPAVRDTERPLRVVLTGGAGQLRGPVDACARRGLRLVALDTTLRDLDDPAGNARRVVTAALDLPSDPTLHVAVSGSPTPAWLAALDVLAEAEAVVGLPLTGVDPAPWIDAALDRELPVTLLGGSAAHAVTALRTTARLWGDPEDLEAARRWCRSWLTDDTAAAVEHLLACSSEAR